MLEVFNQSMEKIGLLENAHNIKVERRVNELWTAFFTLPKNDRKTKLCHHFNYIKVIGQSGREYGLYRIMPTETRKAISTNRVIYRLEHVFATLMDDVMEDYHQFTGFPTDEVIRRILDMQTVKHWVLKHSDFTRGFHYSFENENGLLAPVLSIPQPFDEPYEFTFNTNVYPWELSLIRPSDEIKGEIRWGKNMVDFEEISDPTNIVNYIIPKGDGEGVNQLSIRDVNDGLTYLKDDESIDKWGKRSYIWIDRRFTDAESLKASGQALLDEWKSPKLSFDCQSVDLSIKPEYAHERKHLNGLIKIITDDSDYIARIVSEKISDLNKEWDVDYEINNKLDDISNTQADLERKQQVNDAYSQGATNIMPFNYQDNCDGKIPAVIPFYIDDDVVNVNTVELTFRTKKFRAYSEATGGGGARVGTTKSGGASTQTSSSGGGTTTTSSSGGGTSTTSGSGGGTSRSTAGGGATTRTASTGGAHTHELIEVPGALAGLGMKSAGTHSHSVSIPNHTHGFSTPNHTHSITIKAHTHEITIRAHTHNINIPAHTHEIELPNHTHVVLHKIVELNSIPSSVTIKVDGNTVPHTSTSGDRINLVDYMSKDSSGKITRGRHEVEILPNGLARIEADLILRVFIQSQLGGAF